MKARVLAYAGITTPPPAPQKPPSMPVQVSIKVSHEFGVVPGSSFNSLEVPLEGAKWGQGVTVDEGFTRIAGLRFRAIMARDGAALLYCENRTGGPISVPMTVYGLTAS